MSGLLAHYDKSGTREKFNPAKAPGRRRADKIEPYKMSSEEKERIIEHLREVHLRPYGPELADCFADYVGRYHVRTIDDDGTAKPQAYGNRPSLRQYRYLLNTTFTKSEVAQARKGREYNVNDRGSSGERLWAHQSPGQVYQVDGTIPSNELVSRFDRKTEIGTAKAVYIKDACTTLIVGFHLGFEDFSWETTAEAIRSIGRDWVTFCEKYNVKTRRSDWPATGVYPLTIHGDRSEMVSIASNCLATNLGIVIENSASKRPDTKGGIESEFKQLDRAAINDNVPGMKLPWNSTGRKYQPKSKSLMTKDGAIAYHLRHIIKSNRKARLHKKLPADFEISGLSATPINIWNYLQETRGVMGRTFSPESMRYELMREGIATVKPDGIWFMNARYSTKTARDDDWFGSARAMRKKGWEVAVRWSAAEVGLLYVQHKEKGFFEKAELVGDFKDYEGLSRKELALHWASHAVTRRREEEENLEESVNAKIDSHAIIEREKKLSRKGAQVGQVEKSAARNAERFADKAERREELTDSNSGSGFHDVVEPKTVDGMEYRDGGGMRDRLKRMRQGVRPQ